MKGGQETKGRKGRKRKNGEKRKEYTENQRNINGRNRGMHQ